MAKITKHCGAHTHQGGTCNKTALANGRCKLHGGKSTGPRTVEGRARIAAAQRLRWQRIDTALAAHSAGVA